MFKFEIWQSFAVKPAQWYWHLKARNGRIIATGGEGYSRYRDLVNTLNKVFGDAGPAISTALHKALAEKPARTADGHWIDLTKKG